MRILVLTPKLPWPPTGGAEIRNFNLLKHTAARHEVVLLSLLQFPDDHDHFPALQPYCREIIGLPLRRPRWRRAWNAAASLLGNQPFILREYFRRELADSLRQQIRRHRIDVVHAHFLHAGQYASAKGPAAFVYDAHNLEHVLWDRFAAVQRNPLLRAYARTQSPRFVQWQRRVARQSEKVVTLSDADRAEYQRICPEADVTTVPNGADTDYFQPRAGAEEPDTLLYFANFGWAPQDDAALYLHREVMPLVWRERPQTKLYLVGKTPPPAIQQLACDRVVVTGFVPDIREYIARAGVVVMPLRVGAGTKHRIYQSLAMAKALVATTIAAEGMPLVDGETALVRDDPAPFAAGALELLGDPALRRRLGTNGHRLVAEQYDWRANYRLLDAVFEEAVAKRRRRAAGRT
ncbi:glycosyltransferase [bacterium]|nr:glycosyltransferase [bacterium]